MKSNILRLGVVAVVAACYCISAPSSAVNAQTIDLTLDLTYANPADDQSGGTFTLEAASGGGFGIAGVVTRLVDVNFGATALVTPGTFNWMDPIPTSGGDVPPILLRDGAVAGDTTEVTMGQDTTAGGLVYDIGDPTADLLVTGSFDVGKIPYFSAVAGLLQNGNLFDTSNGSTVVQATVSTSVTDNLGGSVPGDYNNTGLVEQGDLDLVLLNWGDPWPPTVPGWINQQPEDGVIDQNDLDGVLLNWGNSAGVNASVVPEPTSLVMLAIGLIGWGIGRTRMGV